jgi:hypothetical protein
LFSAAAYPAALLIAVLSLKPAHQACDDEVGDPFPVVRFEQFSIFGRV